MIGVLVSNWTIPIIFGVSTMPSSTRSSGVINIGYQRSLSDRIAIEGTYSHEKISLSWDENSTYVYQSFNDKLNTIMVGVKFKYTLNGKIELYGRTDLGYLWYHQSNQSDYTITFSNFAFQITPIGLSFGKALRGFCEFGFGHLGIINFGINYNF
jgi:hypothetical protein